MNLTQVNLLSAKEIAREFLGKPAATADFSLVILDEDIIERPKCFVFFYESSKYLGTNRFEDRLAGNAPILVDRKNGAPRFLGTAEPVENYISAFELER